MRRYPCPSCTTCGRQNEVDKAPGEPVADRCQSVQISGCLCRSSCPLCPLSPLCPLQLAVMTKQTQSRASAPPARRRGYPAGGGSRARLARGVPGGKPGLRRVRYCRRLRRLDTRRLSSVSVPPVPICGSCRSFASASISVDPRFPSSAVCRCRLRRRSQQGACLRPLPVAIMANRRGGWVSRCRRLPLGGRMVAYGCKAVP